MKIFKIRKITLMNFIVLCLLLVSCSKSELNLSNSRNASIIENNSNVDNKTIKHYCLYDVGPAGNDEFCLTMANNPIDNDYEKEIEYLSISTEMIPIANKFQNIWLEEINNTINDLKSILIKSDNQLLDKSQNQWLEALKSDKALDGSMLFNTDKYDMMLGTAQKAIYYISIMDLYKERAINLKYKLYMLETQNNNPKNRDECLSLKFNYKG